jgi:hypothetical protein
MTVSVIGGTVWEVSPSPNAVWGATVGAGPDEVAAAGVSATVNVCTIDRAVEVTDVAEASALIRSPIETPSAITAVDLDQDEHEPSCRALNVTNLTELAVAKLCNSNQQTPQ